MQQQYWQQDGLRSDVMKFWQKVDSCGNPEHEGTQDQIDRENIHELRFIISPCLVLFLVLFSLQG
jgi:hypothetical protein